MMRNYMYDPQPTVNNRKKECFKSVMFHELLFDNRLQSSGPNIHKKIGYITCQKRQIETVKI